MVGLAESFSRGRDQKFQNEQNQRTTQRQAQIQALSAQAFGGPQQQQQTSQFNLANLIGLGAPEAVQQQQQPQPTQAQSALQFAVQFPEEFARVQASTGLITQDKKDRAADFGRKLLSVPFEQRGALIDARIQDLTARGDDPTDTAELRDMDEEGHRQAAEFAITGAMTQQERLAQAKLMAAPTPTTLERNLSAAGLQPGTPEFQEAVIANVTKAGTQVNIGGGNKEQEELAKIRAQDLRGVREKGEQALDTIASLDILDAIDVETGALAPAKQALAAIADGFGIDASGIANVSGGQAFAAESGKLILKIMATQKGPQTDTDRRQIASTIASLKNKEGANKFINQSTRAFSRRALEQSDFFNGFFEQHDTTKGAAKAWRDFKRDTPMVSRTVKTPEGLPVFYFSFRDRVKEANPDASEADIQQAWRNQEAAAGAK
jgi:hypothetical protein